VGNFLSPVVFYDFRESKTHDSFPLELFSQKPFSYILYRDSHLSGEVMMARRRLLMTALTLPEISTQTGIGLLEIGFWMFLSCAEPVEPVEGDPDRPP
jgi:hypothetical protein